jgi:uncharacterized protein (TIGR02147 family)
MMKDIFIYNDYRKILADYYNEHKKRNPWFSYQVFADKAGIANKGFLYNVIRGIKSVSAQRASRLAQAMKLNGRESLFFEILVSFNQTKNLRDRNFFLRRLCAIRGDTSYFPEATEREEHKHSFFFAKEAAA